MITSPSSSVQLVENSIATAFTIASGAAIWVDTDVSALVTNAKVVFFSCYTDGAGDGGVRALGSSTDTKRPVYVGFNSFVGVAEVVGGHVELYRSPTGNNSYYIYGWII